MNDVSIFTKSGWVGKPLPTFYNRVIEAIKRSLQEDFYILVEFAFPKLGQIKGRQCDILVI